MKKGDFQPEATNKTCCHTERLTIERDGEVLYNILRMPMNDEHDEDHHEHDNEHRHTQVSFNSSWRSGLLNWKIYPTIRTLLTKVTSLDKVTNLLTVILEYELSPVSITTYHSTLNNLSRVRISR